MKNVYQPDRGSHARYPIRADSRGRGWVNRIRSGSASCVAATVGLVFFWGGEVLAGTSTQLFQVVLQKKSEKITVFFGTEPTSEGKHRLDTLTVEVASKKGPGGSLRVHGSLNTLSNPQNIQDGLEDYADVRFSFSSIKADEGGHFTVRIRKDLSPEGKKYNHYHQFDFDFHFIADDPVASYVSHEKTQDGNVATLIVDWGSQYYTMNDGVGSDVGRYRYRHEKNHLKWDEEEKVEQEPGKILSIWVTSFFLIHIQFPSSSDDAKKINVRTSDSDLNWTTVSRDIFLETPGILNELLELEDRLMNVWVYPQEQNNVFELKVRYRRSRYRADEEDVFKAGWEEVQVRFEDGVIVSGEHTFDFRPRYKVLIIRSNYDFHTGLLTDINANYPYGEKAVVLKKGRKAQD